MMMLGLRGTGKTVLLNEIGKNAATINLIVSKVECPEKAQLASLLYPEMQKVSRSLSVVETAKQFAIRSMKGLRSFASIFHLSYAGVDVGVEAEPGLVDTGNLEHDLPEMFSLIGKAAQAAGRGWLLLIDEVQPAGIRPLSSIVSLHRISQEGLPVVMVGAGLPQVARLAGEAKSYAERLFQYPGVGALDPGSARQAVEKPIIDANAKIAEDALDLIIQRTQGYPFFIQEWASITWNDANGPEITHADADNSYAQTLATLDQGFFKVRMDRLTRAEIQFVKAMAQLGDGPYSVSDIAQTMTRTQKSLGPSRASIIAKGMIYSTDHGYLDFTVPLFAEFMRRQA